MKPTGQKLLPDILNEIDAKACNCRTCNEDRNRLVKALREAVDYITVLTKSVNHRDSATTMLDELRTILEEKQP